MKIKRFTESLQNNLKNHIEDCFIEFIDANYLNIQSKDGRHYNLYFNFNLQGPTSATENLDNLLKISEYLLDIKTSLSRLKDIYPKIDISCSGTLSTKEYNYYIGIIDNHEAKYEKLTEPSYKLKLKNKTQLDKEDIIKVYNYLNININDDTSVSIKSWSSSNKIIDIESLKDLNETIERFDNLQTNPELLECKLFIYDYSSPMVTILDFELYKLNNGDFIIEFYLIGYDSYDYYLVKNNILQEFIKEKANIRLRYLKNKGMNL